MVWTTEFAFDTFHTAINLSGDHRSAANARRDWVIQRLRSGGMDVLEVISMGSIPRFTALSGHADADVLAVLHHEDHIKDRTPAQVLMATKKALGTGAGSIRRNGQAITVSFMSWPNVDVVPAVRMTTNGVVTGYQIPDMNRGVWLDSNPPLHGAAISAAASSHGNHFRQVIKMLKHWNRRQVVRMQSYHIEAIALQMTGTDWSDRSWPTYQWFKAAQPTCRWLWYNDADVSAYLSYDQANRVIAQLQAAEKTANTAWFAAYSGDDKQAITSWKSVFGQQFPSYG